MDDTHAGEPEPTPQRDVARLSGPPGTQLPPAMTRSAPFPISPATVGGSGPLPAASPRAPATPGAATGTAALTIALLILCAAVTSALVLLLGYVSRRLEREGRLSYALVSTAGLKFWGPSILLALVAGAAVLLVAGRTERPGLPRITAWIFPAMTVIAGILVIDVYHARRWWFVAPVVVLLALLVGTIARVLLADPTGVAHDVARTSLTVVTYVVAFIALAMIYINKLRSVFSATAVAILCILLLLQMTDGEQTTLGRRVVYAVAGGLIVGQVTWVINYWSATGWTGGAFLLAVFYLIAGLSAAQLRDRVQTFDIVEFGVVALVALTIVSAAVWYQS